MLLAQASRLFRLRAPHCESSSVPEAVPFLHEQKGHLSQDAESSDLEQGILGGDLDQNFPPRPCRSEDERPYFLNEDSCISQSRWKRPWTIPSISHLVRGRRTRLTIGGEKVTSRPRRSALRRTCRLLLLSFMILYVRCLSMIRYLTDWCSGILHFFALLCGLYIAFFPEDIDWPESSLFSSQYPHDLGHWPTDITADISPVACHSHNDYWRQEPLFSALYAGCTGVEADVWLYNEDLFVGHSAASLTPNRTLQSLYINPLIEILDKQNPIHDLHPNPDTPRNGVFDTNPKQNLVLLIDFKGDGNQVWPYVYQQLEPLRQKNYLTYFDGTKLVEGPIVVVATGNAPFDRVVENPKYRDIFFDAPLELMGTAAAAKAAAETAPSEASSKINGGQGHSGAAPRDPDAYSLLNSYYASVSFKRHVLGFPLLYRNRLSDAELSLIRAQIAGAHARGLKVRYWSVPAWPISMRNYLWRVLAREGVDYLNVDDLKSATTGEWGKGAWGKEKGWWFSWT